MMLRDDRMVSARISLRPRTFVSSSMVHPMCWILVGCYKTSVHSMVRSRIFRFCHSFEFSATVFIAYLFELSSVPKCAYVQDRQRRSALCFFYFLMLCASFKFQASISDEVCIGYHLSAQYHLLNYYPGFCVFTTCYLYCCLCVNSTQ